MMLWNKLILKLIIATKTNFFIFLEIQFCEFEQKKIRKKFLLTQKLNFRFLIFKKTANEESQVYGYMGDMGDM
jgi:hypothetical protein